jgi:hypothetical protein
MIETLLNYSNQRSIQPRFSLCPPPQFPRSARPHCRPVFPPSHPCCALATAAAAARLGSSADCRLASSPRAILAVRKPFLLNRRQQGGYAHASEGLAAAAARPGGSVATACVRGLPPPPPVVAAAAAKSDRACVRGSPLGPAPLGPAVAAEHWHTRMRQWPAACSARSLLART